MPFTRFEQLLKATMGLDVASVGAGVIRHAVKERQRVCHLKDADAYWDRVQSSNAELQSLIEAVVVPETWFFRDREVFGALNRMAREDWLRANPDGVLRLLSLPCATGEEPYSMAMALLDDGFPMDRCRIDAVDISAQALAHGRRGLYRASSFRGGGLGFRDRHFTATTSGHQIADAVRRHVQFQQGNLFDAGFLPGAALYDVIFCRNMLIYFDRATQAQSVAILGRLLKPQGRLFVGASEAGVFLDSGFVSAKIAMAFAFRKADDEPPRESPVTVVQPVVRPVAQRPAPPPATRAPHVSHVAADTAPPTEGDRQSRDRETGIGEARQLADQGRFVEAARCCEEQLRRHGPSADTFHLLGLVRDAGGNRVDAATYYRKALYLDPNHRETLIHLALLLEDQGKPEAQLLRSRMKRLEQPGEA